MSKIIEKAIATAAKSLAKSLTNIYPAHGKNGLDERNLTYQLAKSFEKTSGAFVFMEVPFPNSDTGRYGKKVDLLAIDVENKTAIFVEAKRLHNKGLSECLAEDLSRMNKATAKSIIDEYYH